MKCSVYEEQLQDWCDGDLVSMLANDMAGHLACCASCQHLTREYWIINNALQQFPSPEVPYGLEERLLSPTPRKSFSWVAGIAAVLCLAVALGLVLRQEHEPQAATEWLRLAIDEPRNVQLALTAATDLEEATLILTLPGNIELEGYPERHELRWATTLRKGSNQLVLPLVATAAGDSEVKLRIEHGGKIRQLRIAISSSDIDVLNDKKTAVKNRLI